MQPKEMTASYFELSTQSYTLLVDALAAANKRALDYTKSVWEITSRPYASTAVETTVRENFDRVNQIVALTVSELQANGQATAELGQKFAAHGAKVQQSVVDATKGLVETGLSNANFVKETATQQFEDVAKRMEEARQRSVSAVSSSN